MKKPLLPLIFAGLITLSITVFSCQSTSKTSGSTTMLKMNLEEGKGYDYAMLIETEMEGGGKTSTISLGGEYSMKIASIDDGVRTIATSYKSIRTNMNIAGTQIDLDSDKPTPDNGSNDFTKNPLGLMNKIMKGMIGKKFLVKVNEEGEVLAVEGLSKIIAGMVDSSGATGAVRDFIKASLEDQFNEQNSKDQFAMMFNIFPNKAVKVGDTWKKDYTTGGRMAAKFSTTYTVKEIEGNHVTLTTNTDISSSKAGGNMTGTQSGNVLVDSKTGLMISSEFSQNMKSVSPKGEEIKIVGRGKIKGTAN